MAREMQDAVSAEVQAARLTPVGLVELEFGSGVVRLWSGVGTFQWGGQDWTGTGTLGSISRITETTDIKASSLDLQLSGIPSAILSILLAEDWQGRSGRVYYAVLDDTLQLIGQPVRIFKGLMDLVTVREGAEAAVSLRLESRSVDMARVRARRWTAEDQRGEYPGDTGCDAVASIQEVNFVWGA